MAVLQCCADRTLYKQWQYILRCLSADTKLSGRDGGGGGGSGNDSATVVEVLQLKANLANNCARQRCTEKKCIGRLLLVIISKAIIEFSISN